MKRRLLIYGISLALAVVILSLVTSLYAGRKILNAKAASQAESQELVAQSPDIAPEQPAVAEPEPQPAEPEPQPVVLPKDPDIQLILDSLSQPAPHQEIPLIQAAEQGNLERVKQLLAEGADVEVKDVAGYTPLYAAVLAGHQDMVSFLLENQATPNVADVMGVTPLMHAAFRGNTEMVRLLLTAGADKAARDKMNNSVLLYAKESNVPEVEALLN